ncbi:xaa-Pro aminopeptidase 2 isoform X2 [Condylostylus longicornis]|nr:xaa-Pro aminopeptidase 2 isoform X2 [Condylostylus longicornis]
MLIRASVEGPEIDGYLLPSYDEHLNERVADRDRRVEYLTGFTGPIAFLAITVHKAALWTEDKYLVQANSEVTCDWELFDLNGPVSIIEWFKVNLPVDAKVGADPHIVPHSLWTEWKTKLDNDALINLVKVNKNLVDIVWGDKRPPAVDVTVKVHERKYAGEKWINKIETLRKELDVLDCDAIVLNSLTEIAYLLNIRGRDIPYTPVVKAYLVVTRYDIFFYTDRSKVSLGISLHLKEAEGCYNTQCVKIKDYNQIWRDLRTYSQVWRKVLMPAPCVFDKGASEALFTAIPRDSVVERISPVIFMKAEKNAIEREQMRIAHIRDGAAMCEAMSMLEERFAVEKWTELKIKQEIETSRLAQKSSMGLSQETVVAYGQHGSIPHYIQSNATDIEVKDDSLLIIESGGQYLEGTTDVSRTFHFGTPTMEQKKTYTSVLLGIIRIANLKFPSNLRPGEIDTLARSPVWSSMNDYPHATGHGIGSYSAVKESPIDVSYDAKDKFLFKEGYFFSNEPGMYKKSEYGVRLGNVLEVINTGKSHPSGVQFLSFEQITLVPYEAKLIDRRMLSPEERRWLNIYNAKIREHVGEELKRQGNMQAFYWMMNKTGHIKEYFPEEEYRYYGSLSNSMSKNNFYSTFILFSLIFICFNSFTYNILI